MKTTKLNRIGVVVRDLEEAMSEYSRILGIDTWQVNDFDGRLENCRSHGRISAGSYRSARGTTSFAGEVPFELVQPTDGETPFKEFLLTKGEGICFLSVLVDDATGIEEHVTSAGLTEAHTHRIDDEVTRTFYDTRPLLGGYLVEYTATTGLPGAREVTLDGASLRGGRDPLPMSEVMHFGVLVDDVMAALPYYRDVFGIETFDMKTWQHEFGRLDDPIYRGAHESTGYFTAQGFVGDFGFEIIQVNYGDCHYNREFTDQRGAGIHHIFGWMTRDEGEWGDTCARAEDLGVPLCMGSDLRGGAAAFGYWDTFWELKGYLVEGVIRRRQPDERFANPDWTVDFTTLEGRAR
ncbi:MAG: VOC family protein [Bowdeniella nasicola]|nr:VOC family protein [Bowdeniella nasicola]